MGFTNNSPNKDENGYLPQIGAKRKLSYLCTNCQNTNTPEFMNLVSYGEGTLKPEKVKEHLNSRKGKDNSKIVDFIPSNIENIIRTDGEAR